MIPAGRASGNVSGHHADEPFSFDVHDAIYGSASPLRFPSVDGTDIAYYRMKARTGPEAAVIFIHGAGAHCSMAAYQDVGNGLAKNGCECYWMDMRGHGNSGGVRGATGSRELVWKDIRTLAALVKKEHPGLPLYVAGHSAGAGTVINYATWKGRAEADGYILISPYLGYRAKSYRRSMMEDPFAMPNLACFAVNFLSFGIFCGNATAVRYRYPRKIAEKDPLIVTSITCDMSKACTLWNPRKQFGSIRKPVGMFIGSEDELFDPVKVAAYGEFLSEDIRRHSRVEIIPGLKHFTILPEIAGFMSRFIRDAG